MKPRPLITASLMLTFLVLLLNLSTEKASAQDANHGRLSGIVVDSQGHTIPGADVDIVNESTGVTVSLTTNSDGFYAADELAVGTYSVKVTKDKFKVIIVKGNVVQAGARWTVDVVLVPGAKTETNTVQSSDTWRSGRVRIIGIQNRKIADSSPSVSATISPALGPAKAGSAVKVHLVVENTSDHEIAFWGALVMFDVRDENGKLAPETPEGCALHFFSPCYSVTEYNGSELSSPLLRLVPHKKLEDDEDLTQEYDLSQPGSYTAVGYLCSLVDQGPGCFRTNTIKITVP
jgi:hypothetical protein